MVRRRLSQADVGERDDKGGRGLRVRHTEVSARLAMVLRGPAMGRAMRDRVCKCEIDRDEGGGSVAIVELCGLIFNFPTVVRLL